MKPKAKVLLSGGLDSMLAVKVLQNQGIEVKGVAYESNFFKADKARAAAKQLNIPLEVVDISKELLEVVKNPQCGHGKCLNPCIDCHALMAWTALTPNPSPATAVVGEGSYGDKLHCGDQVTPLPSRSHRSGRGVGGEGIIATGEVLGQRPMSQNKQSLGRVASLAGVEILRPLSAKLLPETSYEKDGLVDREKLLDISGRGRERQIELANKFGIKDYPAPAGGCLLTEKEFCKKLGEMIKYWPECTPEDVELIKHGRCFWAKTFKSTNDGKSTNDACEWVLIVVGRSKEDNEKLAGLAKKGDFVVELKGEVGPLTVVRIFNFQFSIFNEFSNFKFQIPKELGKVLVLDTPKELKEIFETACLLTGYHAPKARGWEMEFTISNL
jgi:hypothetical protein